MAVFPVKLSSQTRVCNGLKQASRSSWYAHLTSCLKTLLGFEQCLADAWVFRLIEEGRVTIIAAVHVDDIIFFSVGLKIAGAIGAVIS